MEKLLRLEELALFLFAGFLYSTLGYPWWLFAALLLAPDLAMVGYALSPAAGAVVYNLVHHRALALGLYAAGALAAVPWISLIGAVLLAHTSLDRALGYGLKHRDSFAHTHLGWIGRAARAP